MSDASPRAPGGGPRRRADERSPLGAHWGLDPDITFLNHGSYGACPLVVRQAQQRWRDRLEAEPVDFMQRQLEPALERARQALADFVGADAEDLVFVPNATTGVSTVLASLPLQSGDELLVTDHAYNACRNALDVAARRHGARVVVARVPFPLASLEQVDEAVLSAAGRRTRLVLLDAVTSPTGLVLPVARLVAALAERGIDTLVDAAHAPGMLPLDLRALGAAYVTGNAHKWLCTPKGSAFLHVRRDRQAALAPLVTSHGHNSPRRDRSRFQLEFSWGGTDDPSPYLCLPDALEFMGGLFPGGWPELRARNRALALQARATLCAALGTAPAAPEEAIGALATVVLPEGGPPRPAPGQRDVLHDRLFETHRIEVPVMHFPGSSLRLLRVSAQAYNAPAEYERLAAALSAEWGSGLPGAPARR